MNYIYLYLLFNIVLSFNLLSSENKDRRLNQELIDSATNDNFTLLEARQKTGKFSSLKKKKEK